MSIKDAQVWEVACVAYLWYLYNSRLVSIRLYLLFNVSLRADFMSPPTSSGGERVSLLFLTSLSM